MTETSAGRPPKPILSPRAKLRVWALLLVAPLGIALPPVWKLAPGWIPMFLGILLLGACVVALDGDKPVMRCGLGDVGCLMLMSTAGGDLFLVRVGEVVQWSSPTGLGSAIFLSALCGMGGGIIAQRYRNHGGYA